MADALQKMQHILSREPLGDKFVTGFCVVTALELARFQGEISGCAGQGDPPFTSAYQPKVQISIE